MENQENIAGQALTPKTRLFLNEASPNLAEDAQDGAGPDMKCGSSNQHESALPVNQFFVGEFPEWDLLPQSGFIRRIKKSKT